MITIFKGHKVWPDPTLPGRWCWSGPDGAIHTEVSVTAALDEITRVTRPTKQLHCPDCGDPLCPDRAAS